MDNFLDDEDDELSEDEFVAELRGDIWHKGCELQNTTVMHVHDRKVFGDGVLNSLTQSLGRMETDDSCTSSGASYLFVLVSIFLTVCGHLEAREYLRNLILGIVYELLSQVRLLTMFSLIAS